MCEDCGCTGPETKHSHDHGNTHEHDHGTKIDINTNVMEKNNVYARQNRRFLGISFALLFFIHFCFLILLQQTFHPVFNRAATISLIGGGLAYVFAFLMFLTSFPYFSKKISRKNWLILHTVGSWWIWYIKASQL